MSPTSKQKPRKTTEHIELDGHEVRISNPDKVLYPATGTTKGDLIDYLIAIAPLILPHIAGHPLTRKRFPDGVEEEGFFEKNCPRYHPEWMDTHAVASKRVRDKTTEFCVVQTTAGLVWLANLAAIELHPALHTVENEGQPRTLVFDLDPGPPAGLEESVAVAKQLRELLENVGLTPFVKLSGGKGLHIWVPVRDVGYDETKGFARAVAQVMERWDPDQVLSRMSRADRTGKVFIDWSQNDRNKTTVSVYSLRARSQPTVSLPVTWKELLAAKKPERLRLTLPEARKRFEKVGDLWQDIDTHAARVPSAADLAV